MMAHMPPGKPLDGMAWPSTYGSSQISVNALFNMAYNPEVNYIFESETVIATKLVEGLFCSGLIPIR